MLVLHTVAAVPARSRWRRPAAVAEPGPDAAVPVVRVTIIGAEPFAGREAADAWLAGLRSDPPGLRSEAERGAGQLNHLLRVHRATVADPLVHEVGLAEAVVARVGYGEGDLVAEGRFDAAIEVPGTRARSSRRERLAPHERLAAVLGGREDVLACEELVSRARRDVAAERPREAALQALIALEALMAEVTTADLGPLRDQLEADRSPLSEAATVGLRGEPSPEQQASVVAAVERMATVLRRHRLVRLES